MTTIECQMKCESSRGTSRLPLVIRDITLRSTENWTNKQEKSVNGGL